MAKENKNSGKIVIARITRWHKPGKITGGSRISEVNEKQTDKSLYRIIAPPQSPQQIKKRIERNALRG